MYLRLNHVKMHFPCFATTARNLFPSNAQPEDVDNGSRLAHSYQIPSATILVDDRCKLTIVPNWLRWLSTI